MPIPRYPLALLTLLLIAVAGCAAPASAPTSPAAPAATVPASATSPVTGDGQSYPGPYFRGRADAPVTIEEYADFQ